MNTPEDIKKRMLENASSDGPRFLEELKARGQVTNPAYERQLMEQDHGLETPLIAPDELLLAGAPSLMRAGSKALGSELGRNLIGNELGAAGFRPLIKSPMPVTREMIENAVSKGTKGVVRVVDNGVAVPRSEFAKATNEFAKTGVKLIDNGKVIPTTEIAKNAALKEMGSSPSKFVPKYSRDEYLTGIMDMLDGGRITQVQADSYIEAMKKLGIK